jgi:hypothetical protein
MLILDNLDLRTTTIVLPSGAAIRSALTPEKTLKTPNNTAGF